MGSSLSELATIEVNADDDADLDLIEYEESELDELQAHQIFLQIIMMSVNLRITRVFRDIWTIPDVESCGAEDQGYVESMGLTLVQDQRDTMHEITKIKQGANESDANYTYWMELTLKLLPSEEVPEKSKASTSTSPAVEVAPESPYKLLPDTEAEISLLLCYGLRNDHPIKLKNCAPPNTIKETIELILKYDEPNRYGISEESKGNLPRHESTNHTNTQGHKWDEDISIGPHVVSNATYSKFKSDISRDVVNDATMDELANMFGAWKIAATDELDKNKRVASTINKMDPIIAQHVFGRSIYATLLPPAPQISNSSMNFNPNVGVGSVCLPIKCHNCQQEGHTVLYCPTIQCCNCQGVGHMSKTCPATQRLIATSANAIPMQTNVQPVDLVKRVVSFELTEDVTQAFATMRSGRQTVNPTCTQRQ
ncbi:hypothetical protein BGZ76_004287 [Entomortierella beljakovae]|nr:hypothetical protein BGZ76_004287 [Entomortierella beljakovae]